MASFLRRLPWPGRAWKPLTFSSANFKRIPVDEKVEEEMFPDYKASRYYPVRIGEVLRDRYQIVGKLGFGTTSTVWLARDLNGRRHVALKLFITSQAMGQQLDNELTMYKHISSFSTAHPGRGAIRDLLDSFDVTGPDGSHRCLVHPPLWESIITFLDRNPARRLPAPVLAIVLRRLFQALDFLHTECKIIHTDIKGDNIMFGIEDDSVFTDFEEQEQLDPSPRKILDDRTIYLSRELQQPKKVAYRFFAISARPWWGMLSIRRTCSLMYTEHRRSFSKHRGRIRLIYGMRAAWFGISSKAGICSRVTTQNIGSTVAEHIFPRLSPCLDSLRRPSSIWGSRARNSSRMKVSSVQRFHFRIAYRWDRSRRASKGKAGRISLQ